jgi:hypothetical protein
MDKTRTIRGMIQEIVIQETRYIRHYVGKVVDTGDDTNKGRVKVIIPYLGWLSPSQAPWCFPRDKHSMIVPKVDEWVEVYFIGGHKDHPVYLGIAGEMKNQITKAYTDINKDVIFEQGDASIVFDEALKQLIMSNVVKIILDSNLGITLNSGDASGWQPNTLAVDPMTGLPHGGIGGGIVKLKGA